MAYPFPDNEAERLEVLRRLKILDTAPTPEFDALAEMAATVFDAPIALISFVDKDHQWFKARVGLKEDQTCREVAFCNYTICSNEVFEVGDAKHDERFRDNDLVTGNPNIRYYVGIPLSVDGKHNVATLCVIDTKPRQATDEQLRQLTKLRDIALGLIKAHKSAVEAKASEQSARRRGKLLSQVERMSRIGAWSLDTRRLATEWSPQVFAIHELEGNEPPSLDRAISFYPEYERQKLAESIAACVDHGTPYQIECDFLTAKGNKRRVRSSAEIEFDDDGNKFLIGIFKDITEQYEKDQKLWSSANLDSLTGIANRRSFHAEIKKRLDDPATKNGHLILLMIDLDNFKDINDSYGHLAGDEVLRSVAQRIEKSLSWNAFCARIGGDEFAVLLSPEMNDEAAEKFAQLLIEEIRLPIIFEEHKFSVGASIGVASHPLPNARIDDLLLKADLALYHVKQNGRGNFKSYEPAITSAYEARKRAILLVRSAIADDRLEPFYQPIIDLRTKQLRGVEALARIRNPDGSILGPSEFWQALNEHQCAHEIDEVMLDLALRDFSMWRGGGLDIDFVSINAASSSIQSDSYAERVLSKLAENVLQPSDLKIEVVESVFLGAESVDVRRVLERLSAEGVRIALDDFGTGFASLSHLRDYPIDCIKIDKSFVIDLGLNDSNTAIVQALIGLGRSMKLEVIAEGIETQGQLDFVSALGSHFGQGYLFSKPLDARQLARFLADNGLSETMPAHAQRR